MKSRSIATIAWGLRATGLRSLLVPLALMFGLYPASTAVAEMVGSVSIELPTPAGFCKLTEGNASDRRAIKTTSESLEKVGTKLLAMSADCQELSAWRANKGPLLDHYAQYQTSIAGLDNSPTETIQKSCADIRASGATFDRDQSMKTAVESVATNVRLNEQKLIGVIAEDPNACYAAVVSKWHTEGGTDKTQLTLLAVTIVKDRIIYVDQFSVYNSASLDQELAKLKSTVAALYAANR